MTTLFSNKNCTISIFANVIILTWIGTPAEHEYKDAMNESLKIAKQHKITTWLTDTLQLKGLPPALQKWSMEEWLPEVIGANCYSKQAVVKAQDIAANIVVLTFKNKYSLTDVPVEFKDFATKEQALNWLTPVEA